MHERILVAAAAACILAMVLGIVLAGSEVGPGEASAVASVPRAADTPASRPRNEPRAEAERAPEPPAEAARPTLTLTPLPPGEGTADWRTLEAKADRVQNIEWNRFSDDDWKYVRDELLSDLQAVRALPEAERAVHPETELQVLAQIGRAAENANEPIAPAYGRVGELTVNQAWYEAAALVAAHGDDLLDTLGDNEQQAIATYVQWIAEGKLPKQVPDPL